MWFEDSDVGDPDLEMVIERPDDWVEEGGHYWRSIRMFRRAEIAYRTSHRIRPANGEYERVVCEDFYICCA